METLIEQLGGEARLRAIVERFVDRMFEDSMIGFFFARADRQRVKDKEFEFAAAHLGAPVAYTGRALPQAHSAHAIMGGHFMRRLEILKQTLAEFDVPSVVVEHWVANTEKLRSSITRDRGSECTDSSIGSSSAVPTPAPRAPLRRRELPITGGAGSAASVRGSKQEPPLVDEPSGTGELPAAGESPVAGPRDAAGDRRRMSTGDSDDH